METKKEAESFVVADSEELFKHLGNLLNSERITKKEAEVFRDFSQKFTHKLTKEESMLFAGNGKTLTRLHTITQNMNACVVYLLIGLEKYNVKELAERLKEVLPLKKLADAENVVKHWIKQFDDLRLIEVSSLSRGQERVYVPRYEKYPGLLSFLNTVIKNNFRSLLGKAGITVLPKFIEDYLSI